MTTNDRLQVEPGTVTCDSCGFRYGAEHTVAPGKYECPVCSETRLEERHKLLVEAAKEVLLRPAGADGNEARRQLRAALKAEEEANA